MIDKDKLIIELQTTADYLFETDRDEDFRQYIDHIISKIKESNFDVIKKTCKWNKQVRDHEDDDYLYDPSCMSTTFMFPYGDKEECFKYCPYCGKEIEEV